MEDLLFGSVDILTSPVVAAITCSTKASVITVGVALTDSSERHLGIAEFVDNEVGRGFIIPPSCHLVNLTDRLL